MQAWVESLTQLKGITTPSVLTRQPGSLVSVLIIYKHILNDKPKKTFPKYSSIFKYNRNPIIIVLV